MAARVAKRINVKTGNEEPLRSGNEIINDIQERLYKRIRHGAPMITNEELVLIYEALEWIMLSDEPDFSEVGPSGEVRGSEPGDQRHSSGPE